MSIFKKEEKLELQHHLEEVLSFSKEKILETYGSYLDEEQKRSLQNYTFEPDFLYDSVADFLEELQELELYESVYPVRLNETSPNFRYSYDFIEQRKTFGEYYLTRGIYELFYQLLPIQKKSEDLFETYFIQSLKEGLAEYYTRDFCSKSKYQEEFYQEYHYPIPSLFSIHLEKNKELGERLVQEVGEQEQLLFCSNYRELLEQYPRMKTQYVREYLLSLKEEEKEETKKKI